MIFLHLLPSIVSFHPNRPIYNPASVSCQVSLGLPAFLFPGTTFPSPTSAFEHPTPFSQDQTIVTSSVLFSPVTPLSLSYFLIGKPIPCHVASATDTLLHFSGTILMSTLFPAIAIMQMYSCIRYLNTIPCPIINNNKKLLMRFRTSTFR